MKRTLLMTLASVLAGCALVRATGPTESPQRTPRTTGASAGSAAQDGTRAEPPETPADVEQRAQAKVWFQKCSASYGDFMRDWRAIDAGAKKVIAEQRGKSFYDGFGKLVNEYRRVRAEAERLHGIDNLPSQYGYSRGTAVELLVAIAELQVATGEVFASPFRERDVYNDAVPVTGDDAFDRDVFCSAATTLGVRAEHGGGEGKLKSFYDHPRWPTEPWMTRAERKAFHERVKGLADERVRAFKLLREKKAEWDAQRGAKFAGDYGVVKRVTPLPGGGLQVDARAMDTPYTCKHTGAYRWNGVEYSDCQFVDLATRESYPFSVAFKNLPDAGIKVGDRISFCGFNPNGKFAEKANVSWNGYRVLHLSRGGKTVHESNPYVEIDAPR